MFTEQSYSDVSGGCSLVLSPLRTMHTSIELAIIYRHVIGIKCPINGIEYSLNLLALTLLPGLIPRPHFKIVLV